jgi:chemotaxis protein methyltransferase CheR
MHPPPPRTDQVVRAKLEAEAYAGLRDLVRQAGGIDLDVYKDRYILRRIAVRQRASGSEDLRAYLKLVNRDPIERARLVKGLTIHVSEFFRNPSTFRAIRTDVLPAILTEKRRSGSRALRLWCVGCACGEEPYSLAILLREVAREVFGVFSTAIFGTDIDRECLRLAKEGAYAASSLAHLPARWRIECFRETGGRCAVIPAVRKLVFFREHDILNAPPYRRIDLLMFRNVLIYMTDALQERVLLALHGALNPGGFLVLGKVEGLSGAARELFHPVDVAERIYRKPLSQAASSDSPAGLRERKVPDKPGLSA